MLSKFRENRPFPRSLWRSPVAWFIGQSMFVILAAFLLGLLVGWFVWGNRKSPSPTNDGVSNAAVQAKGEEVDEAASDGPDDAPNDELERIEGIGPVMAAALRAAGIHTFRQLADIDDDARRAAIEAAGLTFAPSLVTWGRQAQLLADGDEEGFAELTERLVAGRDTGRV